MFAAHRSQVHPVPDTMADEAAVLVEPLACAIHAALRGRPEPGSHVLVVGAGTVGILVLLALRELTDAGRVTVVAKHPGQGEMARRFGATEVVGPDEALTAVRRASRALRLRPERGLSFLLGGVDVAVECVGTRGSLELALRTARGGGRVVLAGLPASGPDLAPAWFRELEIVGAYASGTEQVNGRRRSTFDMAVELAADVDLHPVLGATYPLARWREAIDHAMSAGRLGTWKVAFDPREDR
jgi:threonine dehydrogenase-like Zn-dependent dehydrogenase